MEAAASCGSAAEVSRAQLPPEVFSLSSSQLSKSLDVAAAAAHRSHEGLAVKNNSRP